MNKRPQPRISTFLAALGFAFATLLAINVVSAQTALTNDAPESMRIAQNQATAPESPTTIDSLAPPENNLAKLVPQISLAKPVAVTIEGDSMTRYIISVDNYQVFPNSLFEPATYLKPLAEHLNSSRAWVYIKDEDSNPLQTFGTINSREQLKKLWFAIEKNSSAPKKVYVDIWDRQTDSHFKSAYEKIPTD
ncbi:hypothetical protein BH11CYA1_BH11CYA1_22900 [soil metagenome]